MDEHRRRLAWIQRNRSTRDRSMPAGRIIGDYAAGLMKGVAGAPAWMRDAIRRVADDEFEQWCRVRSFDRGIVVVSVANASLVGWLARTWRARLLDVLREGADGVPIRDVRFEYHRECPMSMDGGCE